MSVMEMSVAEMIDELNKQEDAYLASLEPSKLIPNFNKVEKKALRAFTLKHATAVVDTYIHIADDKLSREQVRRSNRAPRKITRKTVEAREFMGLYN